MIETVPAQIIGFSRLIVRFVLDNTYKRHKFPISGPLESMMLWRIQTFLSYHSPDYFMRDYRLGPSGWLGVQSKSENPAVTSLLSGRKCSLRDRNTSFLLVFRNNSLTLYSIHSAWSWCFVIYRIIINSLCPPCPSFLCHPHPIL